MSKNKKTHCKDCNKHKSVGGYTLIDVQTKEEVFVCFNCTAQKMEDGSMKKLRD
jgi:protein-arginine kinase activator protein McsA